MKKKIIGLFILGLTVSLHAKAEEITTCSILKQTLRVEDIAATVEVHERHLVTAVSDIVELQSEVFGEQSIGMSPGGVVSEISSTEREAMKQLYNEECAEYEAKYREVMKEVQSRAKIIKKK